MKKILMSACLCFALGHLQTFAQTNGDKITYEVTQEIPLADFLSALQSRTTIKINYDKNDLKDIRLKPIDFKDKSIADIADYLANNLPVNVDLAGDEMFVTNLFGNDVFGAGKNVALKDLVVTALGIKREERALSYNVQKVNQDELTRVKDPNFVNSLDGKVAGVQINRSGSGIGGSTRVVMRGVKSIEGDNNVLYVIDGIPIFNKSYGSNSGILGEGKAGSEGIADFNPEDIESISVLAGPSAAALYGSNAANGAILITTKKGKDGKLQINFSSSTEFSTPFILPKFQNTYGNVPGAYESWGSKLAKPSNYNPKDFFQTGTNYTNALTLSTGNKHNQTFVSVAATNAKGIIPNNTYERYNFSARNTSVFLNDRFHLDIGGSYIKQKDNNMVSQGLYWNPIVAAYLYPRGEDFEKIKTFERYNVNRKIQTQYWPIQDGVFANQNPYWIAYRNLSPSDKDRYMLNAGVKYDLFDWMDISSRFRMDKSYITNERKLYATTEETFAKSKGFYDYSNYNEKQLYADVMLNINRQFNDFSMVVNLGSSFQDYEFLEREYRGNLILVPNLFSIQNIDPSEGEIKENGGDSPIRNIAVFGSAEFGYKKMIYLTMTGRNDWNSRLVNSDEPSYFYPSIGLSNIISKMVKLPSFISFLKLRGSYTVVGSPVSKLGMTPGTITIPIQGGVIKPTGIYPFTDFKAERTKSYEVGLSAKLWKNLSLEATYYKSNTYNQTFLGELPESSGYKFIYLQAGDVQNFGIEASLGYNAKMKDFSIASNITFTANKNEIKEMVHNYKHPLNPNPIDIPQVEKERGRVILKEGGSINDIYATKFLKKDNQGYVYIPESGELTIEAVNPVFLGKTTPDFTLGWNNSFGYKNFNLNFLLRGRFGGVVTSSTQAIMDRFGVSKESADARDAGGVQLQGGTFDPKKYYSLIGTGETELAGYYTYDATNIRLQQVSLSYTLPDNIFKKGIKEITLSLIGNNILMIYNKAPFDPELTPSTSTYGQGNDYFMQPSLRSFGFGLKVKM
ncbi:SusC/RagA family TonB-linked outer membrane protein [Ornithobacterium rhinotracheale]|uniref:SusC/RagA family TonB-linked outer membrane protein n=1 Tax=Ornithobacterium rhinotracheale TaxID=28251 RepID=UPI00129C4045|nr:SusC/RagA family TonB-linked outer membrane protein [Ornithobacterium rhinotracheale]MRI64469.1 SusC/RagA family TonB-linked outer membrane protein [Ornithobacterium rhinotracheale]